MFSNNTKVIKSRYLPERSYLYYKYPQPAQRESLEFYFPLFENVDISESQRSNLGSYDLIGRAGTLYSYHGAKSREFNLKFYITLPNILDYVSNVGFNSQFANSFRYFGDRKQFEKQKFLNSIGTAFGKSFNYPEGNIGGPKSNITDAGGYFRNKDGGIYQQYLTAEDKYENFRQEDLTGIEKFFEGLNAAVTKFSNSLGSFSLVDLFRKPSSSEPKRNYIEYFILLINIVRTSTLNNSKNTNLGPPMIYINHGTLYNNIPCVCTNYSIRLVTDAGYHLKTMTPHRVEISLNLSETRVGNFGDFKPFDYIQGENLAGWEAIVDQKTLDPYNDTFGTYDKDLAGYNKAVDDYLDTMQYDPDSGTRPGRRQQNTIGIDIGGGP